jgi:LPS sulfotransferase NodH
MRYLAVPSDLTTPIQDNGFASVAYDNPRPHSGELKKLYVLVSTPRSGSTALCSEIYRQTGLVVHEYLQPFQYMPCLASRYGAIQKSSHSKAATDTRVIVLSKYFDALVRHRAINGTLGINCHVSHLVYLEALIRRAKDVYPDLAIYKDYLSRQDKYRQAASYAIARQTRLWSTTQQTNPLPLGKLQRVSLCISAAHCYHKIKFQDQQGLAPSLALDYKHLFTYERDIQHNLEQTASKVVSAVCLVKQTKNRAGFTNLQRQASSLNDEIARSIRRHMVVYRLLGLIGRPLRRFRIQLCRYIEKLKSQPSALRYRFLLEVES